MAMEKKETWLESILISAMDAIVSIDPENRIIFYNKAAESLFGYSAGEILGKPLNILLPERYRSQHTEHIKYFRSTGTSTRRMGELGTVFGLRSNGEEFPLEASISQFDMEGEKYLTVILRDITKRLEFEESIAESKETYQNLFNSISDAVFVQDQDGKFLSVNRGAVNIYGYSCDEFTGQTFALINAGGDIEMDFMQSRLQSVNRGMTEKFEWKCKAKDGTILQNEFTLTKGTYFGQDVIIATAHDITERKKNEEQIKLFENIIRNVNDSIAFVSKQGIVLFVNQAFCRTYGYMDEEIVGKDIQELLSPSNPAYVRRQIFSATFKNGWSGELQARKKNGEDIPVYLSTSAIYNTEGKPAGLVVVSIDMTKQKQLEGQVIHSHKMESLRVLVEGIAHNFNNILAVIMGYSALSQHENVSRKKIKDNLDVVLEAVERGSSLVKQLFTFSALSATQLQNIDLHRVIEETIEIIQETFPKDITVSLDLAPSKPHIAADNRELRQAFLNVLINSREAMPEGGRITISTRVVENISLLPWQVNQSNKKNYIHLSITDTGIGMNKEIKEKSFVPFYTTKDIGQGMGLGLTITYGIIERYNGFIDVESSPGSGTTVHMYLPIVSESADIITEPETPGLPAGTDISQSQTILIVEDEDAFQKLLANNLENLGYSILTAADGLEAIELFEEHRQIIDIVLLDIGLPLVSGHAVLQKIRETNTTVKVIVMTGYDIDEIMPNIDALSVNDIIQKPFDIDYMIDRVREILSE